MRYIPFFLLRCSGSRRCIFPVFSRRPNNNSKMELTEITRFQHPSVELCKCSRTLNDIFFLFAIICIPLLFVLMPASTMQQQCMRNKRIHRLREFIIRNFQMTATTTPATLRASKSICSISTKNYFCFVRFQFSAGCVCACALGNGAATTDASKWVKKKRKRKIQSRKKWSLQLPRTFRDILFRYIRACNQLHCTQSVRTGI